MKQLLKTALSITALLGMLSFSSAAPNKIEQLFSFEMIGADIAYFESLAGIAQKTDTYSHKKYYVADGCNITMGYRDQSVDTLSVELDEHCQFTLREIIPYEESIRTDQLRFGNMSPANYYSDCLSSCGNAYDPLIHELYQSARNNHFREILLSSIDYDFSAHSAWVETMEKIEGREWIINNRHNCDPSKYGSEAAKALKGTPATRITIGYELEKKAELQFGCDEPSYEVEAAADNAPVGLQAVPFQVAYQKDDYRYLVGSQVLSGELSYVFNEMYDQYQFWFHLDPISRALLNFPHDSHFEIEGFSDIPKDQIPKAMEYLNITTNIADPAFIERNCSITGPAKLHIVGAHIYWPEQSEPYLKLNSLQRIEAGPYTMSCERF